MPKVARCINGHFYDAQKYSACPYCVQSPEAVNKPETEHVVNDTVLIDGSYMESVPITRSRKLAQGSQNKLSSFKSCKKMDEPYVFISYAHDDADKVYPFFEVLENNHFRYWFDEGLPTGKDFYEQISKHIKGSVQFVLFLSNNAQKSENVKDEIHVAYKYKKNILVVYIEEVDLEDGLELMLDRKQCLKVAKSDTEEAKTRFYNELSKDAITQDLRNSINSEIDDQQRLELLNDKYTDIRFQYKSQMSELFEARQIGSNCRVIIKKILFDGEQNKEFFKHCYHNEKKVYEFCNCPFLPKMIDCGEYENYAYIVETFIAGEKPSATGGYSEEFVVSFALNVCRILKYLYHYGVIHCDIKPDNFVVNEFGDVFLLDFGSCRFIFDDDNDKISCGTLGFAAPEQLDKNSKIDFRTDIFGLGKTMLVMLAGDKISSNNYSNKEQPFAQTSGFSDGGNMTFAFGIPEVKIQYMTEELKYYDANANPMLNRIIKKMVSPIKENRYISIDRLMEDLFKCKEILDEDNGFRLADSSLVPFD